MNKFQLFLLFLIIFEIVIKMDQTDKLLLPIEEASKEPHQKKQDQQSKWKSKSLNSLPTEHYQMDITKSLEPKKIQTKQTQKQSKQTQKQGKKTQTTQKLLPAPKIKKINEKTFCITTDNQINIFYYLDANQKIKLKTKKSFGMIKHQLGANIEFTAGNNSNFIFIGTLTQLIILDLYKKQDKYFVKELSRKQIPNLRAVTFVASQLIAVSSQQVYQYNLSNFDLVAKKAIQFQKDQDKKLFNTLKPVGLVVQSIFCFYYFGTIMQQKIDYNSKKKYAVQGGPPPSKQCEVLHIVKFKIQQNLQIVTLTAENQQIKKSKMMTVSQLAQSRIISIKIQIFPIDHVFQTGIFQKSKIFEIQESVFLMSLHQEIILIKKHFNKFIVWDNVSIVSSKSQQKKGQLVLADKRILVYSQNGEIFAHDIFFNQEESRINMPPIDGFRGNDNDEQILYDAVLLQYDKESLMKVLFYFKQIDVVLPNKSKFRKQPQNPTQVHDQNALHFTMLCINQSDPKQKLKQLLRLKKQPNQIAQFCERFGINSLQKTKCMWSVSDKSLKDIQNVLLEISDDKYIQTELDNILKKQPHNLTFLISVQKKQIARLKKLLVRNMLNDSETSQATIVYSVDGSGETAKKKIQYAKKVIQWLMESIMFQKKLDYSKNFLSFKEYDFIEIGKLKAASLKQQIKLLSCKKYQKRLKYFLNSFKILAIANWEQIFRFLLINKNQKEIQQFLIEFGFILPKFYQTSHVFQQKQPFRVGISKKMKDPKKQHNQDEKCILWDDLQEVQTLIQQAVMNAGEQKQKVTNQSGQRPLNTIQDFQQMVIENIKSFKKDKRQQNEAIQNFKRILKQIVESNWFSVAAFKQHSMLNKTSKQLKQQFYELKNRGAYKILIKYLYQQIQNSNPSITNKGVDQMLMQFVSLGIIPQSFKKNDDSRLQVYKILEKKSIQNPSKEFSIPKKSEYLIWNEDQYFSFLFKHIREEILKNVKQKYEKIEVGFFRQRFQLYLKSTFVNLKGIINFLSEFQQSSCDDVRVDIFNCIKRLLKLGDYQNTRDFIQKSLEKQVLPQKSGDVSNSAEMNLRQQAKIPYGFVFYHFFKVFNLDYTYEELIQSTQNTNLQTNNILKQLIHKYCAGEIYKDTNYQNKQQCKIIFEDHKITNEKAAEVDILDEPLQFFGVLLYMVSILEFQVVEEDLFKFMLQEYLNEGKVDMITLFINSIVDYTINSNSLNTKNYQLITDFKQSHNTQEIFIEYSLGWISRNYSQIKQSCRIESTLKSIESVLEALKKFQQQKIKNEQHLFSLLSFIKRFNPQLMKKVDFIKQQLYHSGFIFLMHIFRQIGVDCFINCNCEAQANQQSSNQSSNNTLKHNASNINTKIYYFNLIFDKYKQISKCEVSKNTTQSNVQFVRFLVELCCILIGEKKYQMAWQLLLRSVTNSYYYNDAFFYFVSVSKIQKVNQFKQTFRIYLGVDTTKILVQKLREMFKNQQNSNRMLSILQEKSSIFDLKGKQHHQNAQNNYLFLFEQLVQNNRVDQACYFLIRIRSANMKQVQDKLRNNSRYGKNLHCQAYILLVVYFKCLQKYISEQFYPTFLFFKTKFQILIDSHNRKDMIKDINIAISRLKQKFDEEEDKNQLIKKDIEESYKLLKQYYEIYMISINEDPIIKLTVEDEQLATKRIQMYAKITPQDDREGLFEQENRQQKQAKLKLQQNQLKMDEIHEKNKLNVVRKEVNESISEARRNADKYANMLEQKKKQQAKISYAQKKQKEIEQIKRKQMEDVASIKQSYKSTTTQKVNDLIQNLRKKRQNINDHRAKNVALRQEVTQNVKQVPSRDYQNLPEPYKPSQNLPTSKYQVPVKIQNDNLMPVTAKIGMKSNDILQNMKKSNIVDRQGTKKQQPYKINSKNKITRQEISDLLKEHQPQAYKYLQKFDLIKQNLQIAVQLVKRMYSATNRLQNFVQFVKYLLDLDAKYKQILQEKCLPIVAQMIKMSQKINLKQLLCPDLFINVQKVALKDYYDIVYTTLRPNIMKILQKQEVTIHSLGILLRYSLGSETKYFNKAVIDYIKVLLKGYSSKVYDDKQLLILAQKLRNQYLSMQEQNRQNNFQQLINEISSQNLKKKIVDALARVNNKKGESVLGGKQTQQFSRIIKRLSK